MDGVSVPPLGLFPSTDGIVGSDVFLKLRSVDQAGNAEI